MLWKLPQVAQFWVKPQTPSCFAWRQVLHVAWLHICDHPISKALLNGCWLVNYELIDLLESTLWSPINWLIRETGCEIRLTPDPKDTSIWWFPNMWVDTGTWRFGKWIPHTSIIFLISDTVFYSRQCCSLFCISTDWLLNGKIHSICCLRVCFHPL